MASEVVQAERSDDQKARIAGAGKASGLIRRSPRPARLTSVKRMSSGSSIVTSLDRWRTPSQQM